MEIQLSMWNIRKWCLTHNIGHLYSIQEDALTFKGIRFVNGNYTGDYALLSDEAHNTQYKSVLSFGRDKIYFTSINAKEAMNLLNDLIQTVYRWESSLTLINIQHGSLNDLLNVSSELIPYPVWIVSNARIIAMSHAYSREITGIWNSFKQADLFSLAESVPSYFSESDIPEITPSPFHAESSFLLMPIMVSHRYYWVIAQGSTVSLTPGDALLIYKLVDAIRDNLSIHSIEKRLPAQENALTNTRSSSFSKEISQLLLNQKDFLPTGAYTVFRIESVNANPSILIDRIYLDLMQQANKILFFYSGISLIVIYPIVPEKPIPDEAFFSKNIPLSHFVIGQSMINENWENLSAMIDQTYHAMEIAHQKKLHFLDLQSVSTDFIHQFLMKDPMLQSLVHPAIIYLKRLDTESSSMFSYIETLEAFITSGGNLNAAARKLNIHRNSVVSRIERIKSLTGLELSDYREKEALYLSLLIAG